MTSAAELHRLQEIDFQIAANELAVDEIESQLSDTGELERARDTLEECREARTRLEKRQREVEWEVEEFTQKIEPVEKKLYSGTITNPKELSGFQEDVESLKARKRSTEDDLLEVMSAAEEAQQAEAEARSALSDLETRHEAERERLLGEKETATAGLAKLAEARRQQTALLDGETLRLYESLRSSHRGQAVAKVERGTCQGCRITLPMTLVQKARSGAGIVQCSSCDRILYVS